MHLRRRRKKSEPSKGKRSDDHASGAALPFSSPLLVLDGTRDIFIPSFDFLKRVDYAALDTVEELSLLVDYHTEVQEHLREFQDSSLQPLCIVVSLHSLLVLLRHFRRCMWVRGALDISVKVVLVLNLCCSNELKIHRNFCSFRFILHGDKIWNCQQRV